MENPWNSSIYRWFFHYNLHLYIYIYIYIMVISHNHGIDGPFIDGLPFLKMVDLSMATLVITRPGISGISPHFSPQVHQLTGPHAQVRSNLPRFHILPKRHLQAVKARGWVDGEQLTTKKCWIEITGSNQIHMCIYKYNLYNCIYIYIYIHD